jgi:hypothetical protein
VEGSVNFEGERRHASGDDRDIESPCIFCRSEEVANRGKTSAENLKVSLNSSLQLPLGQNADDTQNFARMSLVVPNAITAPAFKHVNDLAVLVYDGSHQFQLFIA